LQNWVQTRHPQLSQDTLAASRQRPSPNSRSFEARRSGDSHEQDASPPKPNLK
jgi:hypothetical protein